MYQQIKEAQTKGDLLFGIGEDHRKRLEGFLNKENIHHKSAGDFLRDQEREYR